MSPHLQDKILKSQIGKKIEENAEAEFCDDFTMRELLQEDWRDLIAAFYFAKQSLVITDERICLFLEQIDTQLNMPD